MSARLEDLGAKIHPTAITKMEKGHRRNISLSDLFAIAAALDVSPLALLLPDDPSAKVAVAPNFHYNAERVRRWLGGLASLPPQIHPEAKRKLNDGEISDEDLKYEPVVTPDGKEWDREASAERARFFEATLPLFGPWRGFSKPGIQHLLQLADSYATAAGDDNRSLMKRLLDQLAAEIERQRARIDEAPDSDLRYAPEQED